MRAGCSTQTEAQAEATPGSEAIPGRRAGLAEFCQPWSGQLSVLAAQTLKPRARNCSLPSAVIFSGPHGGIQTQFTR